MATTMRRVVLTITVLTALALPASRLSAVGTVLPELFGAPDLTNQQMTGSTSVVSRMASIARHIETVTLNESALNADRISITLGGVAHSATRTATEYRRDHQSIGRMSRWTLGGASSSSTITERNGLFAATFFSRDGRQFFLLPGYGQTQELIEIDPEAIPRLRRDMGYDDVIVSPQSQSDVAAEASLMTSVANLGGYEVTLLELYTQSASDFIGSDGAVEAFIANKADCVNTALSNSGYTDGHVRIVHVQKWAQNESSDSEANLVALRTDPAVAILRDLYRADLVGEFVRNAGGIAYLGGGEAYGFHMVGVLGALINFELEHEIGHNLNAQHNLEHAGVPPENSPYPWAYGYYNAVHADVMSYLGENAEFFSSATGTLDGLEMGTPNQDNIRVIALVFPLVSQYYPETGCVPSSTALCLLIDEGVTQGDKRFRITVDWSTREPASGQGQAVSLTSDTGYFWFFGDTNVEMIIKVIDGRSFNNHFWVYASGLTNVDVIVTVTDTITGAVRSWHNPMDTAFAPIQDIEAFAP